MGGVINLVFFHGSQSGERKDAFLREADIFVFPTFYRNECFPLVLLEAMRNNLPCISTDEGGISDIIDDGVTGFIVEKGNTEALVEKMEYLLSHADVRTRFADRGREKYLSEYTLGRFESRMLGILSACITRSIVQ